jgi:hypothetical protein
MELAKDAKFCRDERCYIRLIFIVGRIWFAFEIYRQVLEKFSVKGPWEVSLSLQSVSNGLLCHFGEGWAEPYGNGFYEHRLLTESNVLHKIEIEEWGDPDFCRELAFRLGGRLEDTWQCEQRRFLANRGPLTGQFDSQKYSR